MAVANIYQVVVAKYLHDGTFGEEVVFVTDDKFEAAKYADEYKKRHFLDGIVSGITVVDSVLREYMKRLGEYEKSLTEQQKKETVVINGKLYSKWILDFKAREEQYNGR